MHSGTTNKKDRMFPPVSEFLKDAAVSFATSTNSQSKPSQPISVSLGNPAGDADSIISAIALAYIDTTVSAASYSTSEKADSAAITTPIVSIPHESLTTQRPETKYLLEQLAKIDLNHLIAIDCPNLPTFASVSLVDHNSLTIQHKPDWTVTTILDHHMDESQHMDSCRAGEQRIVAFDSKACAALVASTCTLMVERFPTGDPFPPSLAILLLGVILLDSVNLSPKAGKATPRDEAAVQALLDRTSWSELSLPNEILSKGNNAKPDLAKLFYVLQNQKFEPAFWNSLTLMQALQLDFKSFKIASASKFGVASVLQTMTDFMEKNDWMNSMDSTCHEFVTSSFEVFAIMFFSFSDSGPKRQLALLAKSEEALNELTEFLKRETPLELEEVKRSKTNDGMYLVCLNQGNPKASRKQLAPILINYFKRS